MKKAFLILITMSVVLLGCSDDDETIIQDPTQPNGVFTASAVGTFNDGQNGGSMGMVEIGTDESGDQFLHFLNGFSTNLGTGTVSIYITDRAIDDATEFGMVADPANGNPNLRLIGPITVNGESFIRINTSVSASLDYVQLWCGSVNVPWGWAQLL